MTLVHEMNFGQPQQPLSATAVAAAAAATGNGGGAAAGPSDFNSSLASSKSGGFDGSTAAAVADQAGVWSSALPDILARFREAVEAEFPQLYAWFDESSLHVTVRAIIV